MAGKKRIRDMGPNKQILIPLGQADQVFANLDIDKQTQRLMDVKKAIFEHYNIPNPDLTIKRPRKTLADQTPDNAYGIPITDGEVAVFMQRFGLSEDDWFQESIGGRIVREIVDKGASHRSSAQATTSPAPQGLGTPMLAEIIPTMSGSFGDQDASQGGCDYHPHEGDLRAIVQRQIHERRGQSAFRNSLLDRYDGCCLVTGCQAQAVLEAAHIKPYRGDNDYHPENGLLLRADIHTLFDLDLLGIDPDHLRIELHPDLAKHPEYTLLHGQPLRCPPNRRPSSDALRIRHVWFQARSCSPA